MSICSGVQLRKKSGYRLRGINKPITYCNVREDVLNVLKKLGLSSKDFRLHSMRPGECTMTRHLGVIERLIKKHVCWKSDRVKDGYILVSQNLGL